MKQILMSGFINYFRRNYLKMLTTLILIGVATSARCGTFKVNNIVYISITENTAEVESGYSASGDIIIPSEVEYVWEEFDSSTGTNVQRKKTYKVVGIGSDSFGGNKNITGVTIPEGFYVGNGAFAACTSLSKITLYKNTKIEDSAFEGCTNIGTLTIPAGTTIGTTSFHGIAAKEVHVNCDIPDGGLNGFYEYGSFKRSNIEKLILTDNVSYIGKHAFIDSNIGELIIANGVNKIANSAFLRCSGFTKLIIPESIQLLGSSAFSGCNDIESLYIDNSKIAIQPESFRECTSLKEVWLGNNITSIEYNAFYNCSNIENVTIPGSVKKIGETAFYGCTNIGTLEIQDGVESIANGVFFNCNNISSVILPNSIKKIGYRIFYNCSNITDVKLSESIDTIPGGAFYNCENIKELIIPANVKHIDKEAFKGCSSLKQIRFASALESIGAEAFLILTDSLESIHIEAETPPVIENNTFYSQIYDSTTLYVPLGCLEVYKNNELWGKFKSIKEINETCIDNIEDNVANISVNAGILEISGVTVGERIYIYSINGTLLKHIIAECDKCIIPINDITGNVILKIGTKAIKILL